MRITKKLVWAVAALILALATGGRVRADIFIIELPDFERLYGGIAGDNDELTTYDFGFEFASVTSVTLALEGFTDIPESTVGFLVELEGVPSPEVEIFVTGPPIFPPYEVHVPLLFDASVLDGMGDIMLTVNTSGPGADLSTTVELAQLIFEGTPIPAPPAVALLALGALARRRRR
ncbi:MAG: hypothetical protein ACYTFF_07425 [Planctomycetota bacterium]|jgi:MYXO-CTERM domain-containing protein